MIDLKSELLRELSAARVDLWAALDALDENIELYPTWHKKEFYAHLAGWDALVFGVFRAFVNGQAQQDYGYRGVDESNAYFVAVRAGNPLADVKLESEINRFGLQTLLEAIADFERVVQLPWGQETVAQFVRGAITHERDHLADIRRLLG